MAERRLLIFNADDYGLSACVSAGILAAAEGVVRSTTVMANHLSPPDAESLRAAIAAGRIHAGAHLNLSSGPPLSAAFPAELLREDGCFDKPRALNPATWDDPQHCEAAVREWRAQLARLDDLKIPLTHLDSHHHTHLLPGLFELALELAAARGLGLRVRAGHRATARAHGVRTADAFVEGYFGYNYISRAHLLSLLEQQPGGAVEVMCHPGRVDATLRERSGYLEEREAELAVLGDPGLAEELCGAGWRIGSYADLPL